MRQEAAAEGKAECGTVNPLALMALIYTTLTHEDVTVREQAHSGSDEADVDQGAPLLLCHLSLLLGRPKRGKLPVILGLDVVERRLEAGPRPPGRARPGIAAAAAIGCAGKGRCRCFRGRRDVGRRAIRLGRRGRRVRSRGQLGAKRDACRRIRVSRSAASLSC